MGVHNWAGLSVTEYLARKKAREQYRLDEIELTETRLLTDYEKSLIRRSEIDPREPK